MFSNTTGNANTANGADTLQVNTTGSANTASGDQALISNTTRDFNTAIGANALLNNKNGSNNIALGFSAGDNLTTGDNNIDIGAEGVADESDTIRIGLLQRQTFIAGIRGVTTANTNAIPVTLVKPCPKTATGQPPAGSTPPGTKSVNWSWFVDCGTGVPVAVPVAGITSSAFS